MRACQLIRIPASEYVFVCVRAFACVCVMCIVYVCKRVNVCLCMQMFACVCVCIHKCVCFFEFVYLSSQREGLYTCMLVNT